MGKKSKNSKGSVAKGSEARIAQIKLNADLTLAASLREEAKIAAIIERSTDPVTIKIAELLEHAKSVVAKLEAVKEAREELSSLAGDSEIVDDVL